MSVRLLLAAALAASLTLPAAYAGPVPVAPFTQVSLHGGGSVVLKHGAVQRVTILRGSAQVTSLTVTNDKELDIEPCGNTVISCPVNYDLQIEIVSPLIDGVSVHGGGEITTAGDFPAQGSLAAAVHGGGDIDVTAIRAANVAAAVHGGGDIKLTATATLTAAVHGGGDIAYRGNPQVTQAVNGGGSVERLN